MVSALTSFMRELEPMASVAARRLPDPEPPSRRHVSMGVFSLTRTCSTSARHV